MNKDSHYMGRLENWLKSHQALLFLIAVAVLGKILPHPDNFTPMAAVGLFSGAYLGRNFYLVVPVIAAIISDILGPGMYNFLIMLCVYAGHAASACIGRQLLYSQTKIIRLPIAVLCAALGFYLLSNFGNWWVFYEHSAQGLITCYLNGLPYLGRSLAGCAFYSIIFFSLYEGLGFTRGKPIGSNA